MHSAADAARRSVRAVTVPAASCRTGPVPPARHPPPPRRTLAARTCARFQSLAALRSTLLLARATSRRARHVTAGQPPTSLPIAALAFPTSLWVERAAGPSAAWALMTDLNRTWPIDAALPHPALPSQPLLRVAIHAALRMPALPALLHSCTTCITCQKRGQATRQVRCCVCCPPLSST